MFWHPFTPLSAALGSVIVAVLLLWLGYGVAQVLLPRSVRNRVLMCGLAFPSLAGFACALTIVHMLTRGALFASAPVTRIVTGIMAGSVVGVLVVRRSREKGRVADLPGYLPLILVAASWALWAGPLVSMIPVGHIGDQMLHMGWTGQLLNGAAVPSSGLAGDIPNYYPWLFHALAAWISRLTPGGRAFHGQGPLLLVQLAGSVLTLHALGCQLGGRVGGAAAALFGALSGGFGWVKARGPALVFDPRAGGGQAAGEYLGDLLYRRPYSSSFHNLVPVFPRDVAYVLLGGFLLLAIVGLAGARGKGRLLIVSGLLLGLVGLTGGETFLVGLAAAVGIGLCEVRAHRLRTLGLILLPALGLSSLWFLPLVVNYVRLGGFVDTASPPITLTPLWILGSWGVVVPIALIGLSRIRREWTNPAVRVATAFLVVSAAFVALAGVIPRIGGTGFTTLGRAHRYWPLVHYGMLPFAALGASRTLRTVSLRSRGAAVALGAVTVALAIPSPLLGSLEYSRMIRPEPALSASLSGREGSFYNLLAPSTGQKCVGAVPYSISLRAFAYSGYRFVLFPMGLESSTQPRIRFRDIFDTITPPERRFRDNRILVGEVGSVDGWRRVVNRYDVDVVVTRNRPSPSQLGKDMRVRRAAGPEGYWVLWLGACPRA